MKVQMSIIIVNYYSFPEIVDCVSSIYKTVKKTDFEIIIVNNGINKKPLSLLKKYPNIIWEDMGYNAGFARGNNAGIKLSSGKFVLLLNPDVILKPKTVDCCIERMNKQKTLAGAGCRLILPNGKVQPTRGTFDKAPLFTIIPYLNKVIKAFGLINPPQIEKGKVEWITGAFMCIRKDALIKYSLFDEDFFLYAEEKELCSRLLKYGPFTVYDDLEAHHLKGTSSGKAYDIHDVAMHIWSRRERQHILSELVWFRKQFGVWWYLIYLFSLGVGALFFFPCKIIANIYNMNWPWHEYYQPIGYFKNFCCWLGFSPYLILNKPCFYKAA